MRINLPQRETPDRVQHIHIYKPTDRLVGCRVGAVGVRDGARVGAWLGLLVGPDVATTGALLSRRGVSG